MSTISKNAIPNYGEVLQQIIEFERAGMSDIMIYEDETIYDIQLTTTCDSKITALYFVATLYSDEKQALVSPVYNLQYANYIAKNRHGIDANFYKTQVYAQFAYTLTYQFCISTNLILEENRIYQGVSANEYFVTFDIKCTKVLGFSYGDAGTLETYIRYEK